MAMTRRDRLMATLRGDRVDRPAVSFYELNGLDERTEDSDPFCIYTDPSWHDLITLTREKTDRVVMRHVPYETEEPDPCDALTDTESWCENDHRYTVRRIQCGSHVLTSRTRRDKDVNTTWTEEHLLKNEEDLRAYLSLPLPPTERRVETRSIIEAEEALGDSGIVMIDTPDPLCCAASLFSLAEFTVIALTSPSLFHALLERFASMIWAKTAAVSAALPGRLWRIYGPEYATPPYLPPHLFDEYVCRYVEPMIKMIHAHGGYARIHAHGRVRDVLPAIVAMGADAIDPLEPSPQGDVALGDVRYQYGKELVLFGNIEVADIENLPPTRFAEKARRAIAEGTAREGRGFVLMPSACPYGRKLSENAYRNYEIMCAIVSGD